MNHARKNKKSCVWKEIVKDILQRYALHTQYHQNCLYIANSI